MQDSTTAQTPSAGRCLRWAKSLASCSPGPQAALLRMVLLLARVRRPAVTSGMRPGPRHLGCQAGDRCDRLRTMRSTGTSITTPALPKCLRFLPLVVGRMGSHRARLAGLGKRGGSQNGRACRRNCPPSPVSGTRECAGGSSATSP